MSQSRHRHDITDHTWELLEPHLPGRKGVWGGVAQDNRRFSMQSNGFCVPEHSGVICHPIMVIGRTHTAVFAGGAAKA